MSQACEINGCNNNVREDVQYSNIQSIFHCFQNHFGLEKVTKSEYIENEIWY